MEKYWDNEKNTVDPYTLPPKSGKKVWIKCQKKDYHESYILSCGDFINGQRCSFCGNNKTHPKDSFAQRGMDKYGDNFLEKYWDFNKNKIDPWCIKPKHNGKIWIKCQNKDYHGSYETYCKSLDYNYECIYCTNKKIHPKDSFAQWGINNIDEMFLENYWDSNKNALDPWKLASQSMKVVWIRCQKKDYHGSYRVSCNNYYRGRNCPYCSSRKIHILDSVGTLYPVSNEKWSKKNIKKPFEYGPSSNKKVYLCCEKHGEYKQHLGYAVKAGFACPQCSKEREESYLQEKVRSYLSELGYTLKHEYKCTLKPINPKTDRVLLYDNEVAELKLIIEVDGRQHYEYVEYFHKTRREFRYLRWKDNYKKEYALKNKYFYLEVPYWSIKEDEYKNLISKKIQEIVNKEV